MSAVAGSIPILRAAPVLGRPVPVGVAPEAARLRLDDTRCEPAADAFDRGYAEGLAQGRAAGFEQGRAEGWRSGREDGWNEAAGQVRAETERAKQEFEARGATDRERVGQAVATLREARRQLLANAEEQLCLLGFELACKVVGPALASADGVRAQVHLLLREAPAPSAIHVHPSMAAELSARPCEGVRWVADAEVRVGGAWLQGAATSIDARTGTILENFRALLVRSLDAAAAQREQGGGS